MSTDKSAFSIPRTLSGWIAAVLLGGIYVLAGRLGLKLAFVNASATAVWPAAGIAMAAFLIAGARVWPSIFLGAFVVNFTTTGAVFASTGIAVGNTLEGLIGAALVTHFANGRFAFDRPGDILGFAGLGALLGAAIAATIGATTLALSGLASWADFESVWLTWWLGDAVGIVMACSLILLWFTNPPRRIEIRPFIEAVGLFTCTVLVGFLVFGEQSPFGPKHYPIEFLCLPIFVWSSFRFGQRETVTVTGLFSSIALWGTLHGQGPFVRSNPNESLLLLQTFMGVMALGASILTALVLEQRKAQHALREASDALEVQVMARTMSLSQAIQKLKNVLAERRATGLAKDQFFAMSPDLLTIAGFDGYFRQLNPAWEKTLGFSLEELKSKPYIDLIHPDDREATVQASNRLIAAGELIHFQNRYRCKDGRYKWLDWSASTHEKDHLFYAVARDITESKRAEDELLQFAKIVEASGDAIIGKDLDGVVTSWNKSAERIYGYSAAEMIGRHISVVVPADRQSELAAEFETIRQGRKIYRHETERIRKDGTRIHVEVTAAPIVDLAGNIIGLSTISRDITERIAAPEALATQQAELLGEQAARSGAEKSEQRAAFLAQATAFLLSSLDFDDTLNRVLRLGLSRLAEWTVIYLAEEDGSIRAASAHADPAQDEYARLLSRRKLDMQRPDNPIVKVLQSRKSELLPVLDDDVLKSFGYDGADIDVVRALGLTTAIVAPLIVRGRVLGALLFASSASHHYTTDELLLAEELSLCAGIAIDNARLYTETVAGREALRGREEAMARARDAAVESAQLKSQFVANVSHEIRTPMNAIIGMAGLLLNSKLSARQKDFVQTLRDSCSSLMAIINDILDFSKIEAGKFTLENEDFDVHQVTKSAVDLFAARAHAKGLELLYYMSEDIPRQLRGDATRLRQILVNLIANAVKFTSQGSVSVRVRKESEIKSHVTLRVSVTDTGIGLSDEQQERLFEPFMQGDRSTSRKYGGTGLGLAISNRLAELMGGQIDVESVPGEGATFTCTLRFEKAGSATTPPRAGLAPAKIPSRAETTGPAPHRAARSKKELRILVAEDSRVNQKVLLLQLKELGYKADVVGNGREAVEALAKIPYDIVLMDCQMPEMDGYDATAAIRKQEGKRHIPIIAMTANAMTGDREKCLAAGMEDYIAKPVTPEVLKRALARWGAAAPAPAARRRAAPEPDLYRELVPLFVDQTVKNLNEARAALAASDAPTLRRAVHTIKGSGSHLGLAKIVAVAAKIEAFAVQNNFNEAARLLPELEKRFAAFRKSAQKEATYENGPRSG